MRAFSALKVLLFSIVLSGSSFGLSQQYNDYSIDVGVEAPSANGLPNFQKTTESIYRGGRPTAQGLQFLKKSGFKTIINLENNADSIASESAMAKRLGLQMYSSPMSWTKTPSDAQVTSILAALKNKQMYPIFIHCHHGMDRTGLIIGLHRVFEQHWAPKDAYAEMLKYGYHPEFKALDNYFRAKTKLR